jgi:hypothetical protein
MNSMIIKYVLRRYYFKVKKMTTVSAVMFEIVEMYIFQIHLHFFSVLYVKAKPWFILFLNLFQNLYTGHFFEKIFPEANIWLSSKPVFFANNPH